SCRSRNPAIDALAEQLLGPLEDRVTRLDGASDFAGDVRDVGLVSVPELEDSARVAADFAQAKAQRIATGLERLFRFHGDGRRVERFEDFGIEKCRAPAPPLSIVEDAASGDLARPGEERRAGAVLGPRGAGG